MAGEVLDHARALAVDVRRRLLQDSGAVVAGAGQGGVDVGHAQLDELRDDPGCGRDLLAADVGYDDRPVVAGAKLGAMRVADADPLLKAERRSSHATAARTSG